MSWKKKAEDGIESVSVFSSRQAVQEGLLSGGDIGLET